MAEYSVAGWADKNGDWHDTEENPDDRPTEADLLNSGHLTIRYVDSHGDVYYRDALSPVGFTLSDLDALADSFEERYGIH